MTEIAEGDSDSVMFVSLDLGMDKLKLATVDHIIHTFGSASADFEGDEDRLGSRFTPTSIC